MADVDDWQLGLRLVSLFGMVAFLFLAWLMSSNRRRFPWRIVVGGLLLQWLFAILVFSSREITWQGRYPDGILFFAVSWFFDRIQEWVLAGTSFLVGFQGDPPPVPDAPLALTQTFIFGALSTIIFFSALMSGLYYLGMMQPIVRGMAWVMQRTLGISGPESLAAAANVFVGQTEAPLVVRPYIQRMTMSELNCLMVGGFATITGGLMAIYVSMGVSAGHLLTASIISAPAAILIAKIMQPEMPGTDLEATLELGQEHAAVNLIDAISTGAADGMRLAINVAAMLLAFLALIAMANSMLGGLGYLVQSLLNPLLNEPLDLNWTFEGLLGWIFWPVALLMGMEARDCWTGGQLLGVKLVANEFVAYQQLSPLLQPDATNSISPRSVVILTYALCGFSNFGAIAIQIGGIGGMAPERRGDLARLGLRAMVGGALACCLTGCVAGVLL